MDSSRLAWFGIIFVVSGLYMQQFYDFIVRVMGAIMVVIGILVLAFILGAKIGEGKTRYEKLYKKNSGLIGYYNRWNSSRKLQNVDDGRH